MKIPDFHVSNVSVDETFFIDDVDLLEIIISSLVSQYIDQEVRVEDLIEKFTVPVVDTNASEDVQKQQIKDQLPPEQKALPVETQNLIAEVLQSSPPAKVEIKPAIDPATGEIDTSKPKTIEVSAKEELNDDGTPVINPDTQKPVGYDTVVSTFSQEADDTATKVTFEIEQSAAIDEGTDDVVIAAGLYLPRPTSSSRKKTIVQRSVESTVRKVIDRMSKNNEGVYPAIASVMESSYDIEGTNLGKMLNTFYVFFVDVTKESSGLKWSFVYPVQGQNDSIAYNYEPLYVPDTITANVGVTINADYLRKPNVFDITFGDATSGTSFKTSVDLNPPESTSENPDPQPVASIIPFDEPGTPFVVINGGDKVNIKDVEKVFDPPDPTPTPSPTITITHPTPTPSISFTPTTTIHPTPTPTMTVTPSPTTTGTQDITTLFNFTQNGADVDVSLNTNQMNIEGTTEDIAGFTLAFFVSSSMTATTGDGKVSLIDSFGNFEYRYATSNNVSNVLYITGYCSFIGSQEVSIDRMTNDGYMNVLRINDMNVNNISPVNPSFNNVVAISNKEAKLWELNMAYNASIRSGFYVSDMTDEYIMLHVDGSMFEDDASSFKLNLEGIVIESVEDTSEFNGWDILVNEEKDGITATKKEGYMKMRKGEMRRLKLRYSEINGDIKIKDAYANDKKIESGYLIPEDVHFDNGIARIRTKHLKVSLLKSFLVMTKGDLGTVTASQLMIDAGWAVESKYSARDGYTRIMGYSTTSTPRDFVDMDALFRYTKVVRTQRIAPQFPGYAFVNALNINISTMANVNTSEDTIEGMSRFTWLLDHIADKTKIPDSESLKEFFVKSDVTFDGRILVNDVVALKQYILGGLTYPDKRPLGVFEVKYTISGVSDVVFGQLSSKLNEISAAIETKIYETSVAPNDAKNISIIGAERTLSGDMIIYARVFWSHVELYNNAIMNSNNMFEAVQYLSYSLEPEKSRPDGIIAVEHNGGTSFTVYGYGLTEISYSTYYTSESKTISGLSTSAYSHDITIPDGELQSSFDVLYVSGNGGRTVATAVSDIPTPSISATPSPTITPSITNTFTVTPTITKSDDAPVPTPTMTVTITDGSEKQEPPGEPSGYDVYARIEKSGDFHVLQLKPVADMQLLSLDFQTNEQAKFDIGSLLGAGVAYNDMTALVTTASWGKNESTFKYAGGMAKPMALTGDEYTTVLQIAGASNSIAFATSEVLVGAQTGGSTTSYTAYTPGVSVSSGPEPSQPIETPTPTPTTSSTITPTPTSSFTPTITVTITDGSEPQGPPGEPSGYDVYARIEKSGDFHVLQLKPVADMQLLSLDFQTNEQAKFDIGSLLGAGVAYNDMTALVTTASWGKNESTFKYAGGMAKPMALTGDEYTTVLQIAGASNSIAFATSEVLVGAQTGGSTTSYTAYTPGVTASRMITLNRMPAKIMANTADFDWKNSGDVDRNGTIGSLDAVKILQYVVNLITDSAERAQVEFYGDVDENGSIGSLDAVKILQYVVGLTTLPQRPVSSGPQSSGNPTFDIDILSSPSNWTAFKVKINSSTLNPYEFYTSNDKNISYPASVTRAGDESKGQTELVLSNLQQKRYEQIRSIELVMNEHVYFSNNTGDDSIKSVAVDTSDNNKLHAKYDNMYLYCSRTSINSTNETRVMIVNAHNHLNHSVLSLKPDITIDQTLYINTAGLSKGDILEYINWDKTYIGTTSIYKAEYDTGTTENPSYVLTKYNGSTGNSIKDFYWKKQDGAQKASSTPTHGLFLRFSLDDGTQIIPGGVSKESLTSHGATSRLMIDDMYIFGNVDGNVEE